MKENTIAGFVVTCVGDDRCYSFMPSRRGQSLADRVARHVLKHSAPDYKAYTFLERGSDERQYCSPGVDLPVASIMRSKYNKFPEYHTSKDNMTIISPSGLQGAHDILKTCLEVLEHNYVYKATYLCEPQMSRRGLYPTLSCNNTEAWVRKMMNILAYADGTGDLITLADEIGTSAKSCIDYVGQLLEAGLIGKVERPAMGAGQEAK
jgi:aminopeptidase-like protein